ncbi:IS3 family transposase [Spiroplasma litorale]
MSYNEINDHINWYNNERIQKRLIWKTPTSVGVKI